MSGLLDFLRAHPFETCVLAMLFIMTYTAVLVLNRLIAINTALEAIAESLKGVRIKLQDPSS